MSLIKLVGSIPYNYEQIDIAFQARRLGDIWQESQKQVELYCGNRTEDKIIAHAIATGFSLSEMEIKKNNALNFSLEVYDTLKESNLEKYSFSDIVKEKSFMVFRAAHALALFTDSLLRKNDEKIYVAVTHPLLVLAIKYFSNSNNENILHEKCKALEVVTLQHEKEKKNTKDTFEFPKEDNFTLPKQENNIYESLAEKIIRTYNERLGIRQKVFNERH